MSLTLIVVYGSILPWSTAHHERNWFVYKLRGDRMRIEGDYLRSQQYYESALREAGLLKSKEKNAASKTDLADLSLLRQKRIQLATQAPSRSAIANDATEDDDESSLDIKTNPSEITYEWESFLEIKERISRHNKKKSGNSIYSILLTKENSSAGRDPLRLNEVGDCNMIIGHFADAERLFRQALESSEEIDSLLLASMDRLAQSQWAQEQFKQALDTSTKALTLSQKYAPEKYSQILKLHRAQILLQLDRFDEGEKLCHEVLKNKDDISGENSWYPLFLLGRCQLGQHKYGEAIETLSESLKILEKSAPQFDMRINRVCLALGEVYALSKNRPEAKKFFSRAIDIYCRNGGSHRTNLDTLVARQGHQYSAINKYDVAAFCYTWAAELREVEYGKNHYKTSVMMFHYANALDHLGEHKEASAIRARAQTMNEGRGAKALSVND